MQRGWGRGMKKTWQKTSEPSHRHALDGSIWRKGGRCLADQEVPPSLTRFSTG